MRAAGWLGIFVVCLAPSWTPLQGDPEADPKGPRRPAWLVGVWAGQGAQSGTGLVLGSDGSVSFTQTSDGEETGQSGGRWVQEGQELVVREGGDEVRLKFERLSDEEGDPRLRFLPEDASQDGATMRRRPDARPLHPGWMCGTWSRTEERGAVRLVLMPSGTAHAVVEVADGIKRARMTWRLERGTLVLADSEERLRQAIDFLPDEPGRLRVWLEGDVVERLSAPPALPSYEGPLIGRWDREGPLVEESWTFSPTGRCERRRRVDIGTFLEPGHFRVARGSRGDVLKVESDAGRVSEWVTKLEGGRLTLIDAGTQRPNHYTLLAGSPDSVARQAFDDAAAEADTLATNRHTFGVRGRASGAAFPPEDLPNSGPDDPAAAPDPAPKDVYVGAEVLAHPTTYVGASEEVLARASTGNVAIDALLPGAAERAEPHSARPHVQTEWIFEPSGRVRRARTLFGDDGTAGERSDLRFGKYMLTADVVTLELAGEREQSLRLADGGLLLHDGLLTLTHLDRWLHR